jgi:ABC-type multidrug transport system ATPase subunit/pSer/pThr/pTyr-binding forkhead associated (FHA) protein
MAKFLAVEEHSGLAVRTANQEVTFEHGTVGTIGRDPSSTLVVDDLQVSRSHLRVRTYAGHWILEDLDSSGGTWLDDVQHKSTTIDRQLTVHLGSPDGPTLTLTPGIRPITAQVPIHPTPASPVVSIGRDAANDVVVEDLVVSRRHAILRNDANGVVLEDLASRNGTFVNGQRIAQQQVVEGDVVAIGHAAFRVLQGQLVELERESGITFGARGVIAEIENGPRLVDDVSFELPERSLLGIVGPSGAGKSSLLAVLSGLRDPQDGQVFYQSRDLHRDGDELTKRIGFVPQADLLHGGLTVRESLGFTEQLRLSPDITEDERNQRIDDVLAQLGMSHRSENRIDQLSGGERKRVNVATELLTEPTLLLLDEPASGLDAGLERTLMRMLRELADNGRTVIVVTHSLDSLDLCDNVLVLAPGGVPAFFGPSSEITNRFGHSDLVETFHDLATDQREWRDPAIPRQAEAALVISAPAVDSPPKSPRRAVTEWFSQLTALSRRFVKVLGSDRRNLLLLALQAPVLGVLMLIALPAGELGFPSPTQIRFVSTAGLVLFVILLGSTWLGANNSIREVARERELFIRERSAGLSVSAYVASKALVLGVITSVQSAVLVLIAAARQDGPEDAVLFAWPLGELLVVVALAGVASMALALFVSAMVGSPDRATTLLPIVLILQFVLSAGGVLPEIVDKPVLREMSLASSAQWGFGAAASTADLNELQAFTDQLRDLREIDAADPAPALEALSEPAQPEQRWEHTSSAWFTATGSLVVLTMLPLAGAVLVLRRQSPI